MGESAFVAKNEFTLGHDEAPREVGISVVLSLLRGVDRAFSEESKDHHKEPFHRSGRKFQHQRFVDFGPYLARA